VKETGSSGIMTRIVGHNKRRAIIHKTKIVESISTVCGTSHCTSVNMSLEMGKVTIIETRECTHNMYAIEIIQFCRLNTCSALNAIAKTMKGVHGGIYIRHSGRGREGRIISDIGHRYMSSCHDRGDGQGPYHYGIWRDRGNFHLENQRRRNTGQKKHHPVTTWKNQYDQEYEIPERKMPKRTRDQETLHCEVDQLTAGIPKIRRING
jgi:hypothetical protein